MIILYYKGDRVLKCSNPVSLAAYIKSENLMWWDRGYEVSLDNKPRFPLNLYVAAHLPEMQSIPENN